MARQIAAGAVKAKCLSILDEVNATREPVTVTKRGRPVAAIVPVPAAPGSLFGIARTSLSYAAGDDLLSTEQEWDAQG